MVNDFVHKKLDK